MEKLMSTEDAAEIIRLKPQTLRSLRSKGGGPRFVKLAPNRVAYDPRDLAEWTESRKRTNTCDPGPAGRAA